MAWIALVVAGVLEICWAVGLKYSEGFTRPGPSVFVAVSLAASMYLLAVATRQIPLGTAYAIWVGIGALGTAIAGICLLGEPVTPTRVFCLLLLTAALVGLKLSA
ncbi:MAG TPA: multidrug efflux SMR transporter [Polyangiales bacterium]|nr:multidrug efflux SMR transporter [Polyangiales bacterium]